MSERTLMIGGSGTLGRAVLAESNRAHEFRILTRDPSACSDLAAQGVEVAHGDLLDTASVESALHGVSRVIVAAHSVLGRGRYRSELIDGDATVQAIDAAVRARVEHLIYVSAYGVAADHPLDFCRTKARVEAHLGEQSVRSTIVRPVHFMDFHIGQLIGARVQAHKPVMLFGPGTNPRTYVAASDVAAVICQQLKHPEPSGEVLEIAGPDSFTTLELVKLYEQQLGITARVSHLPLGVTSLAAVIRVLHPGVARVLESARLAETTPQTVSAELSIARFGLIPCSTRSWVARSIAQSAASHATAA